VLTIALSPSAGPRQTLDEMTPPTGVAGVVATTAEQAEARSELPGHWEIRYLGG
jgi:hypothetical protein